MPALSVRASLYKGQEAIPFHFQVDTNRRPASCRIIGTKRREIICIRHLTVKWYQLYLASITENFLLCLEK